MKNKFFDLPVKVEGVLYHIIDGKTYILCLKRSEQDGGFWQPITGTNQSNESLEETLVREINEEVGLEKDQIEIEQMYFYFNWTKKALMIHEYVYSVKVDSVNQINLSDEHVDYKWISIDEAIDLFEKNNNKNALVEFKKSHKS